MVTGHVFQIQRMSVHDGPGLRTTVFLKGCPLSCAWCHNPESQAFEAEVGTLATRCMACGSCRSACRFGLEGACDACGDCVDACPTEARHQVGEAVTPAQLVKRVLADRLFFDQSGGGVTFSGGEPLCQPAFLRAVLPELRRAGVHVALDTCGAVPQADLLELAGLADLVLYDLKHMDDAEHRRWTGVPLAPILDNLRALVATGKAVWLRIPVVPGIQDTPGTLEAMADLAADLPGLRRVHLLPYHPYGGHKALRPGFRLPDSTPTPGPEAMEAALGLFRRRGLDVHLGG